MLNVLRGRLLRLASAEERERFALVQLRTLDEALLCIEHAADGLDTTTTTNLTSFIQVVLHLRAARSRIPERGGQRPTPAYQAGGPQVCPAGLPSARAAARPPTLLTCVPLELRNFCGATWAL
jgi:hypothetical protein